MTIQIETECLVIGSGPGGAYTSLLLARAGRKVLLVEEGSNWSQDSAPSYSMSEMMQKYRNGGLTTTFGQPKVVYIEPICLGGASEINASLCHDPPPEIIDRWQKDYAIDGFEQSAIDAALLSVEEELSVKSLPFELDIGSKLIYKGAKALDWMAQEVPRFYEYEPDQTGKIVAKRQSMSSTLIPKAQREGVEILPNIRIQTLEFKGRNAVRALGYKTSGSTKQSIAIKFRQVFVCCGAIQTPFLLRSCGITKNIGNSLRMHPYVRIAARFEDEVNDTSGGVPPVQISEFKPNITLGGSYSSIPHLALWLSSAGALDHCEGDNWKKIAMFYALCIAQGKGYIRKMPFLKDPFIYFSFAKSDLKALGDGLYKLGQLLFAAGARELFLPIAKSRSIHSLAGLDPYRIHGLPAKQSSISTIHLFSSIPMGENRQLCGVDSYGRVFDFDNVRINDASILPDGPGVNPQKTILALTKRNTDYFLAHA